MDEKKPEDIILYTSLSTADAHMHQKPWVDPEGKPSYVHWICHGCAEYKSQKK